jgi:hypothetical protein
VRARLVAVVARADRKAERAQFWPLIARYQHPARIIVKRGYLLCYAPICVGDRVQMKQSFVQNSNRVDDHVDRGKFMRSCPGPGTLD